MVARGFDSTGVPVVEELSGLFWAYGKRPDGLTLVASQSGKSLCWDVTVICVLADSYVNGAAYEAGAAAEVAASRVEVKYAETDGRYIICLKQLRWKLGVFNSSARPFLNDLGERTVGVSGEAVETSFLFKRWYSVSVLFCCTINSCHD